jgi:hypothetical protein
MDSQLAEKRSAPCSMTFSSEGVFFPAPVEHYHAFESYFGVNWNHIPQPSGYWGGGFRFKEHLGKPLTRGLWEDLVERAGIDRLWILRKGERSEPLLGRSAGASTIYLDEAENVEDILLIPYPPCQRRHEASDAEQPFRSFERMGGVVGHVAGLEKVNFS